MLLVLFQLGRLVDFIYFPIHSQAHETLGAQFVEQLHLLALTPRHQRRENHQPGIFRQRQDVVHHLRNALGFEFDVMLRAMRVAHASVEQAQVVVDFRDRAHGGARIVAGGFLFDGNRGRQAFDQVHIRFFHQLQELARIRGKGFHIAPLAFGVEGVEGEGGFARTGQSGDDDQLVARDVETDVFQVVGARTANLDIGHGPLQS